MGYLPFVSILFSILIILTSISGRRAQTAIRTALQQSGATSVEGARRADDIGIYHGSNLATLIKAGIVRETADGLLYFSSADDDRVAARRRRLAVPMVALIIAIPVFFIWLMR